jgi:hypothetical protein
MNMKKINTLNFEELISLYTILNEICGDYARMTNMYSLASGDELFERTPEDIKKMIGERQQFFNIKNKVKEEIKKQILENYE